MSTSPRTKFDIPFATDAEVLDMVARFEACEWPYPRWTHRAHIAVAVATLKRLPFDTALPHVRHHIDLYNRRCGDPTGYHETVTVLFLRRVARQLENNPDTGLVAMIDELTASCGVDWLLGYYSRERLWSAEAKAGWVEPDLRPLDF